ncbi:MAG: beta-galactosidase [Saccharofermentanales bacterium]
MNVKKSNNIDFKSEFMIGIWISPPKDFSTDQHYRDILDAGISWIPGIDCDSEEIPKYLDLAYRNGLKMLVYDKRISYASPEKLLEIGTYTNEYKDHPAYIGTFVWDEPTADMMTMFGPISNEIRKAAPGKIAYFNLHPLYSEPFQRSNLSYADYLERFMETCKPDVISYDHYPFIADKDNGITEDYFYNLELISMLANKSNIGFWTFIQTLSYNNHREPEFSELRWQVSTSLAYGCRGIQYFTYWTPEANMTETFGPALINKHGQKTQRYFDVKKINQELAIYADYMNKLRFDGVMFSCESCSLPKTTKTLNQYMPIRKIIGSDALIGCFAQDTGLAAFYIVNLDYKKEADVTFEMTSPVIYKTWSDKGSAETLIPAKMIHLSLEPGQGKLICILS